MTAGPLGAFLAAAPIPRPPLPNAPADPEAAFAQAVADAKRLMRLSRTAALATLDDATGAPLATLVGVASDFDGAPLFLMSTLARHTRLLAADPRASVLLAEESERGDPLNHPRVTLNGRIEPAADSRARARYLRRNPKAKLYADFADFGFFRLGIDSVHFNGGFGRADALRPADILASRDGEAALVAAEPELVGWVNSFSGEALARLARRGLSGRRIWRAVGLDSEGLDLAAGGRAGRVAFAGPVRDAAEWKAALRGVLDL